MDEYLKIYIHQIQGSLEVALHDGDRDRGHRLHLELRLRNKRVQRGEVDARSLISSHFQTGKKGDCKRPKIRSLRLPARSSPLSSEFPGPEPGSSEVLEGNSGS